MLLWLTSFFLVRAAKRSSELCITTLNGFVGLPAIQDLLASSRSCAFKKATERVVELTGAETASIHLLNDVQKSLHLVASFPPRAVGKRSEGFGLGEGIAGRVAQTREVYRKGRADLDKALRPPIPAESIKSLCVAPINGSGRVLGVLRNASSRPEICRVL